MLTVTTGTRAGRMCDGLLRRDFLKIGALGATGFSLADLLRIEASADGPRQDRAVMLVYLYGGLSHHDTYDMKPNAPVEVRGEFSPIETNVPGIRFCELLPEHAKIADRISIVNGMQTVDTHSSWVMMTGSVREAGRPVFGSVISRLQGTSHRGLPSYVSVPVSGNKDVSDPSYLGQAFQPFKPNSQGLSNLGRSSAVSLPRLDDRRNLLQKLDRLASSIEDLQGNLQALDEYQARALEMISSERAREAFDVSLEPEHVRSRYGTAPELLAGLRLIEAGVRVVTMTVAYQFPPDSWDGHVKNFEQLRRKLPPYDQAIASLVRDMYNRGLEKQMLLVVCGEFGRTPKINRNAGRDHWPSCGSILVSGGGLKMGQSIVQTDRLGARAVSQPYTAENMLATIYRHMGIDPATTIPDFSGRPRYLVDDRRVIEELF